MSGKEDVEEQSQDRTEPKADERKGMKDMSEKKDERSERKDIPEKKEISENMNEPSEDGADKVSGIIPPKSDHP